VYSASTHGYRYHFVNGPSGGSLSDLPTFPYYENGMGPFPSGYLENETGDVYAYERRVRAWRPVCNIGMHLISVKSHPFMVSIGKTSSFNKSFNKDTKTVLRDEEAIIRHEKLQHPFLSELAGSNKLLYSPFCLWFLNRDGSLPLSAVAGGMQVIADGHGGPMLLANHNMCVFCAEFNDGPSRKAADAVMLSFTRHMARLILNAHTSTRIDNSLFAFLFGVDGMGKGGTYDSLRDRDGSPPLPPQAVLPVPSVLPAGPRVTEPPLMSLFLNEPPAHTVERSLVLITEKESSTMGRVVKPSLQNPFAQRGHRMNR
jgi:hypothetical protein